MTPLSIDSFDEEGCRVIAVQGEIDLSTAGALDDHLEFGSQDGIVVLDLSRVDFIDSTGLRALIKAHQDSAASDVVLRIVAGDKVIRLLEITGMTGHLSIYETRAAAIAHG